MSRISGQVIKKGRHTVKSTSSNHPFGKSSWMKSIILLLLLSIVGPVPVSGQLTAAKTAEVAMGHHHVNATDIEAHKRFWGELLGGTLTKLGPIEVVKFPNVLIFLRQREPSGGNRGTTVNHIGFQVKELQPTIDKLKQAGVDIITRTELGAATGDIYRPNQNTSLAFVLGPDEIKVELLENDLQEEPIVNHHIHFYGPDVPGTKAWYVKMFEAEPGMRGSFQAADVPGVNLTFSSSEQPVVGTQGRVLDHIGFEIKNLEAFCKKLEGMGVKFDRPFQRIDSLNLSIAFFTDPWGTYIELTEGLDAM